MFSAYDYAFIAGMLAGVFMYHVLLNKLLNNPRLRKFFVKTDEK